MDTKRLDLEALIDINGNSDKFVLVPDSRGCTRTACGCGGHKPITVASAISYIIMAEREITSLRAGVEGMWKLIDEAHNLTKGE